MNPTQIVGTVAAVVVVVGAVGGGLAYGAKNAEPGDALYGLRASLYGDVSTDADVQANLTAAEDVYGEAQDLEERGMLTADERARLTASYSLHVNAILRRIAELEADGDADAAVELRTSLRAALRRFDDVFPDFDNDNASSSSAASSSRRSDDGNDESSASQGASSSIFMLPSSAQTSA